MEKIDITIIGAGVVGLAIAARLSADDGDIVLIEKESSFGQGASSRNSEVIHAGIYYPKDSLKAKTCVEGNRMLYEVCQANKIPFKKIGKLIVATDKEEEKQVSGLYEQGMANGVSGLEIIDSSQIKKKEPNTKGACALLSSESGIVDSHKLMDYLQKKAKASGASIVYQSQLKSLQKRNGLYEVGVEEKNNETFKFTTRIVINSAGLNSDLVAAMAGMDIKKLNYELKYCKGEYFRLLPAKSRLVNRLVYPVPKQSEGGLGIHLTPDISGQVKLGPDAEYMKNRIEDYSVNKNKQERFCNSVNKFASFINNEDIYPDMAGIRPKLEGPCDGFKDFVIKEESDNGFPQLINLIGIESPGLTAALSIAKYVEGLIKR